MSNTILSRAPEDRAIIQAEHLQAQGGNEA
jgi:hypothetical protein